jgi:hypothetical protein
MKPLKPVMAALLAASSAMLASPRFAFAAESAEVKTCLENAQQNKNAISVIGCLVRGDEAVNSTVKARIADLAFKPDATGKAYVTDEVLKAPETDPNRKGLESLANDWVDKASVGETASLYFVLGPGASSPDWAKARGVDGALKAHPDWETDLNAALAKFKGKVATPNDMQDFLKEAAAEALKILKDPRSLPEIRLSVEHNDTTAPEVPTGPSTKNRLTGPSSGFDFNDMYVRGAVVKDIQSPDDKGYRRISMKMYTVKQPDGSMQNMIGIVDITPGDPNTPYLPKYIPLTQSGDSTFPLKDGGRSYKLSIGLDKDGRRTVAFSRDDGKGTAIDTNLNDLELARAEQAASGGTVHIGDKEFYVLGQGGPKGSLLFFDKTALDANVKAVQDGKGNPLDLRPGAVADVEQEDQDGVLVPISPNPDLGTVDGKPYHLTFDPKMKVWHVADGKGDEPPKPAATTADAPAPTVAQRAADAAQSADWKDNGDNENFDPATKAKIQILSKVDPSTQLKQYHILFAKGYGDDLRDPNQFTFQTGSVADIFGEGRYVVYTTVTDGKPTSRFFTVEQFVNFLKTGKADQSSGTYFSGDEPKRMDSITDLDLASRLLKMMGASDADVAKARKAINAHTNNGSTGYVINGNPEALKVIVGGGGGEWDILPGDKKTDAASAGTGLAGLKGPGTVFVDGATSTGILQSIGDWDLREKDKTGTIGLYKGTEPQVVGGKTQDVETWGLAFTYKADDKGRKNRTSVIPVFGPKGGARVPMPPKYTLAGLPQDVVLEPGTSQLEMYQKSDEKHGVIAVYRFPANAPSQAKDPGQRCVAPVMWWGVTEQEAKDGCADSSL